MTDEAIDNHQVEIQPCFILDREEYDNLLLSKENRMPTYEKEVNRLYALSQSQLIHAKVQVNDPVLDRYVAMIARLFQVPYAFIALVDKNQVYMKSQHGVCNHHRFQRSDSFISRFLLDESADVELIKDVLNDRRFSSSKHIFESYEDENIIPGIRFYGVSSIKFMGYKIGMIGMIDYKPRYDFTVDDKMNLLDVSITISNHIHYRVEEIKKSLNERATIMAEMIQGLQCSVKCLHKTTLKIDQLATIQSQINNSPVVVKNNRNLEKCIPDLVHGSDHLQILLQSALNIVNIFLSDLNISNENKSFVEILQYNRLLPAHEIIQSTLLHRNINKSLATVQNAVTNYLHSTHQDDQTLSTYRVVDWNIDISSFQNSDYQVYNEDMFIYTLMSSLIDLIRDWKTILVNISYEGRGGAGGETGRKQFLSYSSKQRSKHHSNLIPSTFNLNNQSVCILRGQLSVNIQVFNRITNPKLLCEVSNITSCKTKFSIESFLVELGGNIQKSTLVSSQYPHKYRNNTITTDSNSTFENNHGILYAIDIPCCLIAPIISSSSISNLSILSNNLSTIEEIDLSEDISTDPLSNPTISTIPDTSLQINTNMLTRSNRDTDTDGGREVYRIITKENNSQATSKESVREAFTEKTVEENKNNGIYGNELRVLVVDDSIITQKLMKSRLSEMNCKVDIAENGRIGLNMLKMKTMKTYHIVFVDLLMPIMNGSDMIRQYKDFLNNRDVNTNLKSHPSIIFGMSSRYSGNDMNDRTKYGVDFFLMQPISSISLTMIIDSIRECTSYEDAIERLCILSSINTASQNNNNNNNKNTNFLIKGNYIFSDSSGDSTVTTNISTTASQSAIQSTSQSVVASPVGLLNVGEIQWDSQRAAISCLTSDIPITHYSNNYVDMMSDKIVSMDSTAPEKDRNKFMDKNTITTDRRFSTSNNDNSSNSDNVIASNSNVNPEIVDVLLDSKPNSRPTSKPGSRAGSRRGSKSDMKIEESDHVQSSSSSLSITDSLANHTTETIDSTNGHLIESINRTLSGSRSMFRIFNQTKVFPHSG